MNCDVGADVFHAAGLIAAGKLVAFPTETVYGLGANAFDTHAVAAVFAAKGRPTFDPLIVHVADVDAARSLTTAFSDVAAELARHFWPGPLTLVMPKDESVPDLVTAGLSTVAIRVPRHPVALALIEAAGVPVAAPSANPFGQVSPTTAAHVLEQLGNRLDYILEGEPCAVGIESTVIRLTGDCPTLLRPGGVSLEELVSVIGPVETPARQTVSAGQPQASPGMLDRHYAPRTPLRMINEFPSPDDRANMGLLCFEPLDNASGFAVIEVLSTTGELPEAAANFYAAIRRLDAAGLSAIVATPFPTQGLGRALNDRLRRAAIDD